jgi:hypothetical protein
MSIRLRYEQCCETEGCKRPIRHGDLCSACYRGATPAVRAVCDLMDESEKDRPRVDLDIRAGWIDEGMEHLNIYLRKFDS